MLQIFAPRGKHYRRTERFPVRLARAVTRFLERLFQEEPGEAPRNL